MNSAYFKPVTKPFLKDIEFSSPNTPELFFHTQSGKLEINNNVESRRAEGTSLYLVDLQSTMVSKTDDVVIFNAKITYSIMITPSAENSIVTLLNSAAFPIVLPARPAYSKILRS